MNAPPRYATARTPSRRTYGPAVGKVAAAAGKPFMPWQQLVADVGTEVLEDGTWAYTVVIVTVQRQAGKTTLTGPLNLHRTATKPRPKCWLTAQTRQDGRDIWLDVAEAIKPSPLAPLFDVRRSNGSEAITCKATGGTFRVFAPSEDALHGKANEIVTVDEAWAFDLAEGEALEQAILPTFTTTGGQLWIVSTAGTADSGWLRRFVDRGRAAALAGVTERIAYFEWSLDEQQAAEVLAALEAAAALEDQQQAAALREPALELILSRHPAADRTLKLAALHQAVESMSPAGVLRAYGNVWTAAEDRAIPSDLWQAAGRRPDEWTAPAPGACSFGVAVSIDRARASLAVAWRTPAGLCRVDVLDERPGTDWVADRLEQLIARWAPASIGHAGAGPVLELVDTLERAGTKLAGLSSRDYATACAAFLGELVDRRLEHPHASELDQAAELATTKQLGDAWAWDRRGSAGSIAALEAATVARWHHDHRPTPLPKPRLVTRRRA